MILTLRNSLGYKTATMDTIGPKKQRLVELAERAAKETDREKVESIYREMLHIIDEITRKASRPN